MSKTLIERVKQEELSRWKGNGLIPYAEIIKVKSSRLGFNYKNFTEFIKKCMRYMNDYQDFAYDWNDRELVFDSSFKRAKLFHSRSEHTLKWIHIPIKYRSKIEYVSESFEALRKLSNPKELGELMLDRVINISDSISDKIAMNFIIKQKGALSFSGYYGFLDAILGSNERLIAVGRGKIEEEAKRNYLHLKQYFS